MVSSETKNSSCASRALGRRLSRQDTLAYRASIRRSSRASESFTSLQLGKGVQTASQTDGPGQKTPLPPSIFAPTQQDSDCTMKQSLAAGASEEAVGALPWWKRILIDPAYRTRITNLATVLYRKELFDLEYRPHTISSAHGQCGKTVMAQYVSIELRNNDLDEGSRPRRRDSLPMLNLKETTPPSARAACRTPAFFAQRHPKSLIRQSGLCVLQQRVLASISPDMIDPKKQSLTGFPATGTDLIREAKPQRPPQNTTSSLARAASTSMPHLPATPTLARGADTERHRYVIDEVLRRDRARALAVSRSQKEQIARDVLCERVPLLGIDGHMPAPPPFDPTQPTARVAVARQPSVWTAASSVTSARKSLLEPPSHVRTAQSGSHSPRGGSRLAPTPTTQTPSCPGNSAHGRKMNPLELPSALQAARRRDFAQASLSGTDHLYGMSYLWDRPLPPSGFIRLQPDPCYAMWPNDAVEQGKRLEHCLESWRMHEKQQAVNQRNMYRVLSWKYGTRILKDPRFLHRLNDLIGYHDDTPDEGALQTEETAAGRAKETEHLVDMAKMLARERRMYQGLTPIYDGPLSINIVAMPIPDDNTHVRSPEAATKKVSAKSTREHKPGPSPCTAVTATTTNNNSTSSSSSSSRGGGGSGSPWLLGTFRQSLLLIHFKIYCCALHEEARERRVGHLMRLLNHEKAHRPARLPRTRRASHNQSLAMGRHQASSRPTKQNTNLQTSKADAILLAGLPRIPRPVLRLQQAELRLLKPDLRSTPDLTQVQPARCWVGLFPCPNDFLLPNSLLALAQPAQARQADPVQRTQLQRRGLEMWKYLHTASISAKLAVRDVFHCLDLDADMQLHKPGYIRFVVQILDLFFPTHLRQIPLDIAEEEWVYRGTTQNVGFDTFFEKFFALPFLFHRDLAIVTEQDYIEWWNLVRICLYESPNVTQEGVSTKDCAIDWKSRSFTISPLARPPSSRRRRRSVTNPLGRFVQPVLAHFTHVQIRSLHAFRLESNPLLPTPTSKREEGARRRSQLSSLAESTLKPMSSSRPFTPRLEPAHGSPTSRACQPSVAPRLILGAEPRPQRPRALSGSGRVGLCSAVRPLDGSAHTAKAEQLQHESDLEAVLATSQLYHRRQARIQRGYHKATSRLEAISSSWAMHYGEDGELLPLGPSEHPDKLMGVPRVQQAYGRPNRDADAGRARGGSFESRLIDFVKDLPDEVFEGAIPLRTRFPTYEAYSRERCRLGLLKMVSWKKPAEEQASTKAVQPSKEENLPSWLSTNPLQAELESTTEVPLTKPVLSPTAEEIIRAVCGPELEPSTAATPPLRCAACSSKGTAEASPSPSAVGNGKRGWHPVRGESPAVPKLPTPSEQSLQSLEPKDVILAPTLDPVGSETAPEETTHPGRIRQRLRYFNRLSKASARGGKPALQKLPATSSTRGAATTAPKRAVADSGISCSRSREGAKTSRLTEGVGGMGGSGLANFSNGYRVFNMPRFMRFFPVTPRKQPVKAEERGP